MKCSALLSRPAGCWGAMVGGGGCRSGRVLVQLASVSWCLVSGGIV